MFLPVARPSCDDEQGLRERDAAVAARRPASSCSTSCGVPRRRPAPQDTAVVASSHPAARLPRPPLGTSNLHQGFPRLTTSTEMYRTASPRIRSTWSQAFSTKHTGIAYLTDEIRRRPNLTIRGRVEVDRLLISRGQPAAYA